MVSRLKHSNGQHGVAELPRLISSAEVLMNKLRQHADSANTLAAEVAILKAENARLRASETTARHRWSTKELNSYLSQVFTFAGDVSPLLEALERFPDALAAKSSSDSSSKPILLVYSVQERPAPVTPPTPVADLQLNKQGSSVISLLTEPSSPEKPEEPDQLELDRPTKRRRVISLDSPESSPSAQPHQQTRHEDSMSPPSVPRACAQVTSTPRIGNCNKAVVDERTLRAFYASRPWDDVYNKRFKFSHTFKFAALDVRGQLWVQSVLAFQSKHRQALWERQHWIPSHKITGKRRGGSCFKLRDEREAAAASEWAVLQLDGLALVSNGVLSGHVWNEPFLWSWPIMPHLWKPSTANLFEELATVDAQEPTRSFFVDAAAHHPFFEARLETKYVSKFPLPTWSH